MMLLCHPRDQGLTEGKVDEAAGLYRAGWSLQRLADHYGCSVNHVRAHLLAQGVTMRLRPGWRY